jgi:hypothetical protein
VLVLLLKKILGTLKKIYALLLRSSQPTTVRFSSLIYSELQTIMANQHCFLKATSKISLVHVVLLVLLAYALEHEMHLCFLRLFAMLVFSPKFEPKTNKTTSSGSSENHWLLYSELEKGRGDAIETANKVSTGIPNEEEWLLSKPDYDREAHYRWHGQLIPKRLHKVFLSTTGTYSRLVENVLLELNSTRTENYLKPDVKKVQGEELLIYGHISWKKYNPSYEIRYLNLHQWFSALDDGLKEGSMQTNFFGASPHSPVMREAIRLILHNAQSRLDLNPDFSA